MISILEKFNLTGFRAVNDLAGQWNWLDSFFIFSASWLGCLLIIFILWWAWRDRADLKKIILIVLGSATAARFVIVEAIRYFIYSPRPFAALENVNQLIAHDPTSSLPSGHATFFFALAFGAYSLNKKTGAWLLVLASLTGFARIYVGIHWPLDIIAGALVGWATALIVPRFSKKLL